MYHMYFTDPIELVPLPESWTLVADIMPLSIITYLTYQGYQPTR